MIDPSKTPMVAGDAEFRKSLLVIETVRRYGYLPTQTDAELASKAVETVGSFIGTFPADEPLFLLRGQDACGAPTVFGYQERCPKAMKATVGEAVDAFRKFGSQYPERVRTPD